MSFFLPLDNESNASDSSTLFAFAPIPMTFPLTTNRCLFGSTPVNFANLVLNPPTLAVSASVKYKTCFCFACFNRTETTHDSGSTSGGEGGDAREEDAEVQIDTAGGCDSVILL